MVRVIRITQRRPDGRMFEREIYGLPNGLVRVSTRRHPDKQAWRDDRLFPALLHSPVKFYLALAEDLDSPA